MEFLAALRAGLTTWDDVERIIVHVFAAGAGVPRDTIDDVVGLLLAEDSGVPDRIVRRILTTIGQLSQAHSVDAGTARLSRAARARLERLVAPRPGARPHALYFDMPGE